MADALRRPLGPGPTRKPVRRKREVRHDVILGGATQEVPDGSEEEEEEVSGRQVPLVQELAPGNVTLSQEVMKRVLMSLLGKGFCLLGLCGPHQETVDGARLDALRLLQDSDGADFKPPPSLIVDGLLGEEGSAEIMNLDGFNYERRDKAGLQAADAFLEQIGNELARVDSMLESRISSRSSLILHKAGIPADCDVPELTPMGCQKWLEVDVGPGTLAIVRADGVSHRFFSTARSLAVSCFLLEDASATWRRRFGVPLVTTPVCRDLMDWAKERWELARRHI
ncbi:hypothetical protein AK812_SmicGene43741 [Symbiodinium microadriaticum]|uniref:Uncharacterized protein n=1 Tax=Symbiodinium microadriaticum TaxID=2951 RepID=A0A1Q9C0C5_SYMMI|nr:hypothetical protein AK812_SmicGene43741 [Symbiodinium microadriaticum]